MQASRMPTVLAVLLALAVVPGALAAGKDAAAPRRNHLAGEASPYLQMHVYNPVDWYPWGPEALARARAEGKPIFLSVGYSSCHWCHVMEREVFSDPDIAKLMNDAFVNVKVDREERPDVDALYMQATQLLTGAAGWPNSIFLTPGGKPFFAGSYFPPEDRDGRPGFAGIVAGMAQRWQNERAEVLARADRVAAAVARRFAGSPAPQASLDGRKLLEQGVAALASRYDAEYGGFGDGAKFPSPPELELLLAAHEQGVAGNALSMLRHTLDQMAYGGIHDHLAGGFHRYAVEPSWSLPHFEKMLYDNAQLVGLYARAHRATRDPLYRQVALGIARYLVDEMTSPLGGYYAAQDAESDEREGRSYLWTEDEVRAVLADGADAFLAVYRLAPLSPTRAEPGVLRLRVPIAASLARMDAASPAALIDRFAASRARLLAARQQRPQPRRDEKVLAAWNGLAIRGMVDAGVELGQPELVDHAERAAHFVLTRLTDDSGGLRRSYVAGNARERAVVDDYAFLADGLIALHAATGERRWLQAARQLADRMIADFEGPSGTGFYLAPDGGELFVRPRVLRDGVTPSGNTVALRVMRDLGMLTGDAAYRAAANRTRAALGAALASAPETVGTAVRALTMGPQLPAPPRPDEGAREQRARPPVDRLPTGRDFVKSELRRDETDWVVRLRIAEGWHVNANPASLDFLIPTRVEAVEASERLEVRYPVGESYHPRFSLEPLSVYEGEVDIPVGAVGALDSGDELALTFQACDASSCLPPETVRLAVP